jgi:thiamine pyrophosphokinase
MQNKRAVIFANGIIEDYEVIRGAIQPGDFLVSADGGIKHFNKLKLKPELVVGDLDSVSQDELALLKNSEIEIQLFPKDKDETDLELALIEVAMRGFSVILVMGGLGGRTDHMLANLALLGLPELIHKEVILLNGLETISLVREALTINGKAGDLVSLLAVNGSAAGVTTRGLRYPLNSDMLLAERSRGISNVMLSNHAEVSLKSGLMLCIHTSIR